MRRFLPILVLLALATPGVVHAGIAPLDDVLRQGTATTLAVTRADGTPAAGALVTATYRPGSQIPHATEIGAAGDDGTLAWTPGDAGIVALSATIPAAGDDAGETASLNVSVRHDGPPVLGVVIMIFAGLILYGGVFRGFRNLG